MKASSFSNGEDALNFGDLFAMFEPVRQNPKGKRFGFRNGLLSSNSVRENTGKLGHFADPPAVLFALDLDVQLAHVRILRLAAIRCSGWLTMRSQLHAPQRGREIAFLDWNGERCVARVGERGALRWEAVGAVDDDGID